MNAELSSAGRGGACQRQSDGEGTGDAGQGSAGHTLTLNPAGAARKAVRARLSYGV